ncbi:MAG: hypothetical protein QOH48_1417 [Actinomycetota bacterium]|jgi:hypothetical protein|nr:hypothetical protein [Actinomycetota bacterium]
MSVVAQVHNHPAGTGCFLYGSEETGVLLARLLSSLPMFARTNSTCLHQSLFVSDEYDGVSRDHE